MRDEVPVEINERGDESHPSFVTVAIMRSHGGSSSLFDSDIIHHDRISLQINQATRKRELGSDWIFGNQHLIEVEMSMAQWGAIISSPNQGTGQPATLRWFNGEVIPSAPHENRMAQSIDEVKDAGKKAIRGLLEHLEEVEEVVGSERMSKKKLAEAVHGLRCAIENAPANFAFAESQLAEHVENVVKGAEADIEMALVRKAQELGIDVPALGITAASLMAYSDPQPAIGDGKKKSKKNKKKKGK